MRAFEHKLVVGFEETNLVGNVYFANFVRWQGKCREMFVRQHAPEVADELRGDLALVTTRCSCEYLAELRAFDEVEIEMRIASLSRGRVTMRFDYWRTGPGPRVMAARGEQEVAAMRRVADGVEPRPFPESLARALASYSVDHA
ncbi:MAG TPA: acyl-CoA thioesterase [Myxococcales bacterium]